jgi:hypothetical protein
MANVLGTPGKTSQRNGRASRSLNPYTAVMLWEELWNRQCGHGKGPYRGPQHEARMADLKEKLGLREGRAAQ